MVAKAVPAEIVVTESNDLRSYRLTSKKLMATGFAPRLSVASAIQEIIHAFQAGVLRDEERWYNIKTMKRLGF